MKPLYLNTSSTTERNNKIKNIFPKMEETKATQENEL